MTTATEGGKVIGIDLGTTFSTMAYLDRRGLPVTISNAEGELTTPSVVIFNTDESVVVGRRALRAGLVHPDRVAMCVKREMGESLCRNPIAGREMSAVYVSSLILKKLRQDAEKKLGPIAGAVITVPAYFDEARRQATAAAGALAGLTVLDVLNEPTAAALAYGFHHYMLQGGSESGKLAEMSRSGLDGDGTFLVYDLGGGTFDVTVIRIQDEEFRVLATDGDVRLGGRDWDDRIVAHAAEQFVEKFGEDPREDPHSYQGLALSAEEAKRDLSATTSTEFTVSHGGNRLVVTLTREQFEDMTADLLFRTQSRVQRVLTSANIAPEDVKKMLLVGGSTRMPQVAAMLKEEMHRQPDDSLSADEVVAHGAAIQAAIIAVTGRQDEEEVIELAPEVAGDVEDFAAPSETAPAADNTPLTQLAQALAMSEPAPADEAAKTKPAQQPRAAATPPPLPNAVARPQANDTAAPEDREGTYFSPRAKYDENVSYVLSEIRTVNVNSHSLGVVAVSPNTGKKRTSILIPRNSPLPASRTKVFGSAIENAKNVAVQIVEGDSKDPGACVAIGSCIVGPLPQGLRLGSPISIVFTYDNSGRLHVKARDDSSGVASETVIIRQSLLGKAEMATARQLVDRTEVS